MAFGIHKRRATSIIGAFVCAASLLFSSLSLCFAECTAQNAAEPAAVEPSAPACHSEAQPAAPVSNAHMYSESPGTAICCCLTNAPASTPAESAVVLAPRGAAPIVFAVAVAYDVQPPFILKRQTHTASDLSPPGAPLFIAHHALLI